jgi:hypothetical protein
MKRPTSAKSKSDFELVLKVLRLNIREYSAIAINATADLAPII